MINKFGKVMVYVKDPRAVADFWIEKVGFAEVEGNYFAVEEINI